MFRRGPRPHLDIFMFTQNKVFTGIGWALTGLICAVLTSSAVMKFLRPPDVLKEFSGRLGYPDDTLLAIGSVEIACMLLYAVPRTSVLGAILLTGYLGGAVATHVRVHDAFIPPAIMGALAWLGLYFRDPRIRALIPIKQP
jgi:hypothetical protein